MGTDIAQENRPKIAFVLTGGSSLGAAQVGMLAELCAAGERPDLVVGVSAGAINAAFFAREPSQRTVAKMVVLWASMTTRRALGLSWRAMVTRELGFGTFEETSVPLHVVCADTAVMSGRSLILQLLARRSDDRTRAPRDLRLAGVGRAYEADISGRACDARTLIEWDFSW